MRISVNLDDVQTTLAWEPGWYMARIIDVEVRQARDGESEYLNIAFECIETDEDKYPGYKVYTNCSLKPQALFRVKQLLQAAGIDWSSEGFNTEDMLGAELEIQVDNREYNGELQNDVRKFRAL